MFRVGTQFEYCKTPSDLIRVRTLGRWAGVVCVRDNLFIMTFTWPDVLTTLINDDDLDAAAARWAMSQVLAGEASAAQMAAFLVALRVKGESVVELDSLAQAMLDATTPITLDTNAVDIVGSGGDRANTVNVSTMAAIVAAAAGAKVVKHGNRASSSKCGTADCLEELGLNLDVTPDKQQEVLDRTGLVFLYAPTYHPALRHIGPVRRELAIQTTMNFLGPLANPARPQAQALGMANRRVADLVAGVIARRGNRGLVFHGTDGLDELTTTGPSDIWVVRGGQVVETTFDPAEIGIKPSAPEELVGGDPSVNAQVVRDTLAGKKGAVRDIVTLNAAAALLAFEGPDLNQPVAGQIADHLASANAAIDDGRAAKFLDDWIAINAELAEN